MFIYFIVSRPTQADLSSVIYKRKFTLTCFIFSRLFNCLPSLYFFIMFNCEVCEKVFTVKSNMLRHRKTHDGTKFSCDLCSKIFMRRDNLARHVQEKHGE